MSKEEVKRIASRVPSQFEIPCSTFDITKRHTSPLSAGRNLLLLRTLAVRCLSNTQQLMPPTDLQKAVLDHVQHPNYRPVKLKVIAKKLGLTHDGKKNCGRLSAN